MPQQQLAAPVPTNDLPFTSQSESLQGRDYVVPQSTLHGAMADLQNEFWLDQAMLDEAMLDIDIQEHFNQMEPEPTDAFIDQSPLPNPPTEQDSFSTVCGLTGDMDPYLMQRYRFDSNGNFIFKRLAVRSMSKHTLPVQLLVSNSASEEESSASEDDPIREQLIQLVSPDIGVRLISLYVFPDAVHAMCPA